MGVENPRGRGNWGGCPAHWKALGLRVYAAVYAAKRIIQSSITARQRDCCSWLQCSFMASVTLQCVNAFIHWQVSSLTTVTQSLWNKSDWQTKACWRQTGSLISCEMWIASLTAASASFLHHNIRTSLSAHVIGTQPSFCTHEGTTVNVHRYCHYNFSRYFAKCRPIYKSLSHKVREQIFKESHRERFHHTLCVLLHYPVKYLTFLIHSKQSFGPSLCKVKVKVK